MTTETAWRFLLGLIVAAGWCGCGQSDPSRSDALPAPQRIEEQILSEESTPGLPQPKFIAGACRVYTSEPGWSVFIDGYPVRNPDGSILQTPCRVTAVIGAHSVGVAREGQLDQSRIVTFAEDAELVFQTATAPTGESVLLSAPFLTTAIGEPIELTSLNTTGREFDPFLSPDGRGLLFAAERAEGKGIYTASRLSPLHPFDSPTLLRLTSSIDQPASPSVNGAATMVVYTLPSKGRIRALTRTSPLADFEQPKVLLADEDLTARYPSAQVLSSAERIYFTRETEGILETRVTTPTPERSQPFGNVMIVQFPGVHPRLSTDGLRQYLFDGQTLLRARRTATNLPFGPTEEVAQIELSGYQASAGHRQFCVSDDEQWLVYSDDPVSAGDLWMVRLSAGPGWGLPLSGTTIEPRVIAKTDPEMRPEEHAATDAPDVEPETPPDPRAQPLPYETFRQELAKLTAARDFTEALARVEAGFENPDLESARDLLEWDREDIQQLIEFWEELEAGVMTLQPGDKVRLGTVAVDFEKYADGVVTVRTRTQSVEKPLAEFDAAALVSLAEPVLDENDQSQMLRPAVFLTYSGDGSSSRRRQFLEAAGLLGLQFEDRLAAREASLARMEIDRENIGAALNRVETIRTEYAETTIAADIDSLTESLYARTEWRQVGRRRWETGPEGEFTAGEERVDGAILISPRELGDFTLTMEYRTNSPTGQGGVYFTYTGDGRLDRNALKVQLSNDAGVAPDPYCTGALFGSDAPRINAAGPQGEWNRAQISVRGIRLTVRINGRDVLNTPFSTGDRPREGYIALDGVSGGISYRRIILSDQAVVR